jgi:poly-beta-1,6-N-acetyl-D-glucosamine synthase
MRTYALVTACHNESENLPGLIVSVSSQSVRPAHWVIVDDRSTDRSFEIAEEKTHRFPWVTVVRSQPIEGRYGGHTFVGKVGALNSGLALLQLSRMDYIGILDADITLPSGFYARLVEEMEGDPQLGLAAGQIFEALDNRLRVHRVSTQSASGGTQFFRSSCFVSLAGFRPFPHGGEDAALEIEARARGWRVKTIGDLPAYHRGEVGGASGNRIKARFKRGRSFHQLGYHPLFQLARLVFRSAERPIIVGSIAELLGYVYAWASGEPVLLDLSAVGYLRREQLLRLSRR